MMGKINNFLGFNIHQSREGTFINQESYTQNLFERFGMTNCSSAKVPIPIGTRLSPSLDKLSVYLKTYLSMIGSLLYRITIRLDIIFSGCNCASYQANPREPHLTIDKNIFQYLNRTSTLGL